MKRFTALFLISILAVSLTACSGESDPTFSSSASTESVSAEETESGIPGGFIPVSETATALSNVNIRTSCSASSDSIGVLLKGETIERTAWSEEWSQVLYNGAACYIASAYLSESSAQTSSSTGTPASSEAVSASESSAESSGTPAQSGTTVTPDITPNPVDTSNIAALDNTAQGWGYASDQRDEYNRPNAAVQYQQAYGAYNADFLKGNDNTIYLTFDEGYENGYTSQILDTLKEKDVKAVFFVTMPYVKSQPELVQRMIDEGHVVGNHSNTHPADGMPSLGIEQETSDILSVHNYVKENFGYEMYLFRCPAGIFSPQSLAVDQSLGYRTVFWSFAHRDWVTDDQPDPAASLQKCVSQLHPGAIYLLHAVSSTNTQILGDFIDQARAAGYTFGYYGK